VRQHTEGMVGSIIWILLEIYLSFQQWKNFENPLIIDKVIAMSLVYYRLEHSVVWWLMSVCLDVCVSSNCFQIATLTVFFLRFQRNLMHMFYVPVGNEL